MLESPASNNGLRLIFAGTPAFAAHHLQALINSSHSVIAVYTQPDRPAGRGKKLTPSPVKALAQENNLGVYQPVSLKDKDVQAMLNQHKADVMVVVAYGLLLPKAVLDIPHYGCINVHGSLLPRWRGAAPIQRTIGAGDSHSGITIMQMDIGLDTGDMLHKSQCALDAGETSASLHNKLMALGAPALLEALQQIRSSTVNPVKQDDKLATYAEKITKEEAQIDWQQPASTIERNIRAYNPFPVAYSFLEGKRIKFYHADYLSDGKGKLSDCKDKHSTNNLLSHKNVQNEKTEDRKTQDRTQDRKTQDVKTQNGTILSGKPGEIISFNGSSLKIICGEDVLLVYQLQLPGKKPMQVADMINGYSAFFTVGKCFGE